MTKIRITALLTAFSMVISLCSCTLRSWNSSSEEEEPETTKHTVSEEELSDIYDDVPEEYRDVAKVKDSPNLEPMREHIAELLEHLEESDNDDVIQDDINTLLDDYDLLYEISAKKMIPYYLDWNNKALEDDYDDSLEDVNIADALLNYAFGVGYYSDEYSYLFEELYIGNEEFVSDEDTGLAIIRHEIKSRVDNAESDALLDDYHDILYDDDMSDDEKNKLCAELYLDVISKLDADTLYDDFYRDYTGEDITELSKVISDEFIPLSDDLLAALSDPKAYIVITEPLQFDDPFITIQQYAPKLSDAIAKAADHLIDEKLYYLTSGDNCYNGSFMEFLPASKDAYIYIHSDEDYNSLLTPLHEFGHYYASRYDDIPYYLGTQNIDIAETQSQGFEFLFMQFYDDIYGEQAEAMRRIKLYDMMYALITGFLVGEFEYTVLKNKDSYTADDVLKCWEDTVGRSPFYFNIYEINHIYEQPGYYISYGVSALAAFDIWMDRLYDTDDALKKYENIARISCNDKDYQFRSAMQKAGFSDVLNKEYIKTLAEEINDYINGLT